MAEGLAVVSVVASIVQLVDFSTKVIRRLEEFHSTAGEIPKSCRHINTELPVLSTTLQNISRDIETDSVDTGIRDALIPVIDGCREQIAQLDAILAKTLLTTNDSWRTKSKKAIVSLHQEDKVENITKILRNYIATLTFYHIAASSTLQPLRDLKLVKIREWLSAPDPSTNYQKALKQRHDDTGLWFLESDQYAEWKTNATSFFWLHGIAGCGKTILSSTVLQNVLQHCNSDPGKVVAYFFFDFNDKQKQNPELMVRSLIRQLSQQCVRIPTSLDMLFSSCENGQRQPSLHALLEVLQQMMQEFPHIYIVLDALDECSGWTELTDILETMSAWQLQNLHIVLTSRRERDIESSLETFIRQKDFVCLQSKVVDRDIHKYVQQRLSADKRLSRWGRDPALRQDIEVALMKGAQGMFRWAVCQLDALGECRTRASLRKSLATLPPTLDQTYDRILSAISEADSQYAVSILRWLTFSARPLSADEVAEIVGIGLENEARFDPEEVLEDPLDVLNICSSLVAITMEDEGKLRSARQIVVLAHYSVKEYLLSDGIGKGSAAHYGMQTAACHDVIARSCLGYLLQFQGPELLRHNNAKEFRLAEYSAKFWIKHAQTAGEQSEGYAQEAMVMFWEKKETYLNWLRFHNPDRSWSRLDSQEGLESLPAPLYYASLFGLRKIVKLLVDKNVDVNAQGGFYGNALQAASAKGHKQVVKLLLEKNADFNAWDGYYDHNALQAASWEGHEQIVKLLLERNADVNAQSPNYGNALLLASERGHGQVVKLLLEKNANVNAQSVNYGSALYAASERGHEQVVNMLLEKNADVNAAWRHYNNALQVASVRGYKQVVKLLLEKNADVNAQGGEYGNALQAASWGGHEQVVKLMLERNADVNAQGGFGGNALQAASAQGHEQIVKLLLEKNADVNAQGGHYGNALYVASERGHEQVVKLLLEKNADVNAQGGFYGNALQAASAKGHKQVVKLLLEKNADVNAQGGNYGNALQAASVQGHEQVVKLLLERNANVNAQSPNYGNALYMASVQGYKQVVKLLLEKNADVNAQGGHYGNALQAALAECHKQVVKLLLEKNAVAFDKSND
ncbi:ankyrin repeat-containing domain protein [Massariosphaeria phaeospora]|uniref:Ankyrin repeat-containing domain protein n=1 Tax=Massariosphaeria phaeospora TaxID=100035 RepID=A0A7C8HZG7_9PLEO|nr:ankyrin repeat-containing domain protein [Massariosphaeria phaeospora]